MKRTILIVLCVGLSVSLYAQQKKDYAYYNHQIDSLMSVFSVDSYRDIGVSVRFDNAILDSKEQKKLIAKIKKMFEQKEYTNLYHFGHDLIRNMWRNPAEEIPLEIKQMLTELFLQYYFYPGGGGIIIISDKTKANYYTKKAEKRLSEILEDKKTTEEYELWVKYYRSIYLTYPTLDWGEAAILMKQRDTQNATVLKQIRDSIIEYRNILPEAKQYFESTQIDPELIKVIGLLKMKECIPVLNQGLQFCLENDCDTWKTKAYRYALIRLGDKEQRQYLLDNLIDIFEFSKENFAYFQDDELIWKYIDVNYSSGKEYPIFSNYAIPADIVTMNAVQPYIKNLPEELAPPEFLDIDNDKIWSKALYEWLMANKTTVEFDYEGKKVWHRYDL